MPFVGEQPTQAGKFTIFGRASDTTVDIYSGVLTITARSGLIEIGVT
jgi:hypothetical protein